MLKWERTKWRRFTDYCKNMEQRRQAAYWSVALRRVRATNLAVEKVEVCVCSLRYPAYNAHAPFWYLWPTRLYRIFPLYLINGAIFGKRLLNKKCVFWFSVQLMSETFLILRTTERDMIINVYWFNVCHLEVFNTCINIQCCISQTQQNFIMFIIVLGQRVLILIESSSGLSKIQILT